MSKSTLIVLRGLPASGKTTHARQLLRDHRAVRVNRDLLREMLRFGEYAQHVEWRIIQVEGQIATYFLQQGLDVVVDDTNLTERDAERWREVAEEAGADLDLVVMEASIEECVRRDAEREDRTVGEERIRQMAEDSEVYDE